MKMSSGQMGRRLLGLTVAGMALAASGAAFGDQPKPWEYTLQEARNTLRTLQHERELAERIELGIKQLRSRTAATEGGKKTA